jgi:hypothetical protein
MFRRLFAVIAAFMLLAGTLGCASQRQAEYTTTGAGVGAVTGAILGGILGSFGGNAGQGAVIGSIFGGLTGASIGDANYRQERSEQSAAQVYDYNYEEHVKDLLRIEDASCAPKVVRPGDEVSISATYTILTATRRPQMVHEVREVRFEGKLVAKPEVTVRKAGGTWASSVPIRLPEDAEPGTYVVTMVVETDNAGDTRETTFRVSNEPSERWRR